MSRSDRRIDAGPGRPELMWVTTAALVGLILGLFIGWVVWPIEWTDATLDELSPELRARYLAAIGEAYMASGGQDPSTALLRVAGFDDPQQAIDDAILFYDSTLEPRSTIHRVNLRALASAVESNLTVESAGQPVANRQSLPVAEPAIGWLNWVLVTATALVLLGGGLWIAIQFLAARRQPVGSQPQPSADIEEYDDLDPYLQPGPWQHPSTAREGSTGATARPNRPDRVKPFDDEDEIEWPQTAVQRRAVTPAPDRVSRWPQPAAWLDEAPTLTDLDSDENDTDTPEVSSPATAQAPSADDGRNTSLFTAEDDPAENGTDEEETDEEGIDEEPFQRIDPLPGPPSTVQMREPLLTDLTAVESTPPWTVDDDTVLAADKDDGGVHPAAVEGAPDAAEEVPDRKSRLTGALSTLWNPTGGGQPAASPLQRYEAVYHYGIEAYDQSFTILAPENDTPIGACGIGTQENVDRAAAQSDEVRVLEVWLYDRADMSNHSQLLISDGVELEEADIQGLNAASVTGDPLVLTPGLRFKIKGAELSMECHIQDVSFLQPDTPGSPLRSLRAELTIYGQSRRDE